MTMTTTMTTTSTKSTFNNFVSDASWHVINLNPDEIQSLFFSSDRRITSNKDQQLHQSAELSWRFPPISDSTPPRWTASNDFQRRKRGFHLNFDNFWPSTELIRWKIMQSLKTRLHGSALGVTDSFLRRWLWNDALQKFWWLIASSGMGVLGRSQVVFPIDTM